MAAATFAGHVLFAAQVLRLNVREAGIPGAERFVIKTLLPLVWCAVSVALAGVVFPGTDLTAALCGLLLYLSGLCLLLPIWREEWRRITGENG